MIKALSVLSFIALAWQEEIPFKASDEYEVIIDYKLQDRPAVDQYKADFDFEKKNRPTGLLPYLKLQVKLLKLSSDEVKVKVINSTGNLLYNRKASTDSVIKIDLGFIDDVKDRVVPHEFTVLFNSESKSTISKIHMIVMEDGTFLVNNEKKGKF